ncbi:MAG: WD40 repeat protein [Phenylobacterium sp.]|jgi:WD40 repeat protein
MMVVQQRKGKTGVIASKVECPIFISELYLLNPAIISTNPMEKPTLDHHDTAGFRLFVSSTFADFNVERDSLNQVVFQQLRQICHAKGVPFRSVDLRWGISLAAGNARQSMAICLNEVHRCAEHLAPFFLLMVGNRYGWRPLPSQIDQGDFDQGLERLDADESALLLRHYQLDQSAIPPHYLLTQDLLTEHDSDETILSAIIGKIADILALDLVDNGLPCATELEFLTALQHDPTGQGIVAVICQSDQQQTDAAEMNACHQLKAKVRHAITAENIIEFNVDQQNSQAFADAVKTKLSGAIELHLDKIAAQPKSSQLVQHLAFRDSLLQPYVADKISPRETLCQKLLGAVHDHPVILVHGPAGIGKSTVIARLSQLMQDNCCEPNQSVIIRFAGATSEAYSFPLMIRGIIEQLSAQITIPLNLEAQKNAFAQCIRQKCIGQHSQNQPLTIIVDGIDQLGGFSSDWLDITSGYQCRWILGVADGDTLHALRAELPAESFFPVPEMNEAQGATLLRHLMQAQNRVLPPLQQQLILQPFASADNGIPLYLKVAAGIAAKWRSFDRPGILGNNLTEVVLNYVQSLAENAFHGETLVHAVLTLIGASRKGLAEHEIIVLLSQDKQLIEQLQAFHQLTTLSVPDIVWLRLYDDLRPFTSENDIDGAVVVQFYHRAVGEIIQGQFLNDPAKQRQIHHLLADYFLTLSHQDPRKISEAPYHLLKANRVAEAQQLLSDLAFIEAAFGAKKERELLEFLNQSEVAEDKVWSGFVRQNAHILSETPQLTIQQAMQAQAGSTVRLMAEKMLPQATDQPIGQLVSSNVVHYPEMTFSGHPAVMAIMSCQYCGTDVVSASVDGTVLAWDPQSGEETFRLQIPATHSVANQLSRCCVNPQNSDLLAVSFAGSGLQIWQRKTRQLMHQLLSNHDTVFDCCWSSDGKLAAVNSDGVARIWCGADFDLIHQWQAHQGEARCCRWSDSGRELATGGYDDRYLFVWQLMAGNGGAKAELKKVEQLHCGGRVEACCWFPDGSNKPRLLAVPRIMGNETFVYLWTLGEKVPQKIQCHQSYINAVAISDDGAYFATASSDKLVKVWQSDGGEALLSLTGHVMAVLDCAWTADGHGLVTAGTDNTLKCWNIQARLLEGEHGGNGHTSAGAKKTDVVSAMSIERGHDASINEAHFAQGGKQLMTAGEDGGLKLWQVAKQKLAASFKTSTDEVHSCDWAPDQSRIVAATFNAHLAEYDAKIKIQLSGHQTHQNMIMTCRYSPCGQQILSGDNDSKLLLWDCAQEVVVQRFEPEHSYGRAIESCSWSPTSDAFVYVCGRSMVVQRLTGDKGVDQVLVDDHQLTCVQWSPCGRFILCGGSKGLLRLWDAQNLAFIGESHLYQGDIIQVTFSADAAAILVLARDEVRVKILAVDALLDLSKQNSVLFEWICPSLPTAAAWGPPPVDLAVCTDQGDIHLIKLHHFDIGIPFVSASRWFIKNWRKKQGELTDDIRFTCWWCGKAQTAQQTINHIATCHGCEKHNHLIKQP